MFTTSETITVMESLRKQEQNAWEQAAAAAEGGLGIKLGFVNVNSQTDMEQVYEALHITTVGQKTRLLSYIQDLQMQHRQQQQQMQDQQQQKQDPQQQIVESDKIDSRDIKLLADFARSAMESKTEKREMSKASSQFAQELVGAMNIVVTTLEVNTDSTTESEPLPYSWTVETLSGDTVQKGEHRATPGAREWFLQNFLSGSDLESEGYCLKLATGSLLPVLKAGGKQTIGKGDMVIGINDSIELADSVYEQVPGLIELKTNEYPIKVGQCILELTAFSLASRFKQGVVLLASDCNKKWRLFWFHDFNTIYRRSYKSARKCWADFVELLKDAEDRVMLPPQKKRLATLNEDDRDEQDLKGFDIEADKKQQAVDNEATLHKLANYLGYLYGERPVVPDWARAERNCLDYYT